jgi:hypothetical protein
MYRSSRAIMEEVNYFRDARVRNAERYNNRDADEQAMVIRFEYEDNEGETVVGEFPARFEVCPTCEGRGTHVNPSIDASGYYADEDEDYIPDDDEPAYPHAFEQTCGTCHGKRVVLEIDRRAADPDMLARYDAHLDDLDECEADRLAELRAGC